MIIVIVISFCTIVIVDEFAYSSWYQNHMSKSHMIIHVMLLYCTYRIIVSHHLSKSIICAGAEEAILHWSGKISGNF